MNNTQIQLVNLVSCAISGKKLDQGRLENIDWNELLKYAESHQVKALIYSAIHNSKDIVNINNDILEKLKKETLLTALWQMQHLKQVSMVLNKFNKSKIPVIVLKGLVIRELYPRPELRTMCDADILIRESDLEAVKGLLEGLGYTEGESSPVHRSYGKSGFNHIEVHWTISDNRFFKEQSYLEQEMWNVAVKVKVGGSEALSFSNEDLALHLCIHMAVHILTSGFGIRQLCDLALLIEKRGDQINWTSFLDKGRKWRVEKFIAVIFLACKQLFNIAIPEEINKYSSRIDDKVINQLLQDILEGGVYGKKDLSTVFSNEFAYGFEEEQGRGLFGIIKRFLQLLFPPVAKMSYRYNYAKKYKVLIPVAWLHHLFSGITHKRYNVKDKIRFIKSAIYVSIKRHKLLKRLEL